MRELQCELRKVAPLVTFCNIFSHVDCWTCVMENYLLLPNHMPTFLPILIHLSEYLKVWIVPLLLHVVRPSNVNNLIQFISKFNNFCTKGSHIKWQLCITVSLYELTHIFKMSTVIGQWPAVTCSSPSQHCHWLSSVQQTKSTKCILKSKFGIVWSTVLWEHCISICINSTG